MSELEREFNRGLELAMDPTNRLVVEGGRGITTLHSPWLHKLCPVCRHSFRLDDEVFITEDQIVRHNTALLSCAGKKNQAENSRTEVTRDFFRGLDEIWPPPKELPVQRLEQGHLLLSDPYAGFQRRKCVICGHTLRLHDVVIICPCQPHDPRCQVAIHRDPAHNLCCWEEWKPEAYKLYCPATSKPITARKIYG